MNTALSSLLYSLFKERLRAGMSEKITSKRMKLNKYLKK